MWCEICNKHISECKCLDIGERLRGLAQRGTFVYKQCVVCGKHYALCKCDTPTPMSDVINIMEE